jgi:hypothetical protein
MVVNLLQVLPERRRDDFTNSLMALIADAHQANHYNRPTYYKLSARQNGFKRAVIKNAKEHAAKAKGRTAARAA